MSRFLAWVVVVALLSPPFLITVYATLAVVRVLGVLK